tara:strand:- start:407 stop:583 length:177 start_codon:yes stop_codon:yes gene_type:complete
MINKDSCSNSQTFQERRIKSQKRRLEVLKFIRDAIERRLSAINASIETLTNQIERDSN